MDYVNTGNKIGNLVADSPLTKEPPEFLRMQLNGPKDPLPMKHGIDQDYARRVSTFASWPCEDVISHKKLAKAGFLYEGNGDEVKCYSCGVKVKGWKPSDIAVRKHQELSPNCSYIASIFNKASKRNPTSLNNVLNSPSLQFQDIAASTSTCRNALASVETQPSNIRTSESGDDSVQTVLPLSMSTPVSSPQNHNISASPSIEIIERFPNFEKMKSEEERLKTFSFGWPVSSPKPNDLAREGFFYLMEGDRVQCAFCRGVVSHWEPTDDPSREHSRHFAFCPFVMGRDVGNLPCSNNSSLYNCGEDVCGYSHWRNSGPENGRNMDQKKLEKLENFGVKLHHGPKHPAQASKDARFRSFVGWPESSPVQPKALVDAGFFYVGVKDYTRCFYCDGGLCNWEAGDDPWEEHAKWFQHCSYVRLNKGDSWVEACLKKGTQKSPSQQSYQHEANSPVTSAATDINDRVEELMKSEIISSAVRLGVFSPDVIKSVLLKRMQTVGSNFTSHEELCDAVFQWQEIEEQNNSSSSMDIVMNSVKSAVENSEENEVNETVMEPEPMITMPSTKEHSAALPVEDIIKEQRLCKICMDKEIGVLFLPCGHLMSCVECGPALTICPFCRQKIKGTVRAFLT